MRRAKVAEELLEALVAVGLELVVGLVLPVLEGLAAVGADEALGVELVPHGGDHSVQTRLVAHTADGGGGPLVWPEKIFILWF